MPQFRRTNSDKQTVERLRCAGMCNVRVNSVAWEVYEKETSSFSSWGRSPSKKQSRKALQRLERRWGSNCAVVLPRTAVFGPVKYNCTLLYSDSGRDACLLEKLKLEHLPMLKAAFSHRTSLGKGSRQSCRGTRKQGGKGISLEDFQTALCNVIGPENQGGWMERVFNEIDISCNGHVEWEELSNYLLQQFRGREHSSRLRDALLDTEPLIRHCSFNKARDRSPVSAWWLFLILPPSAISVSLAGDPAEEGVNRKRFMGWATDAVYLAGVHKVVVATSCRDLHFVDVSTACCFEDVHLFGFTNVTTSLGSWHDTESSGRHSLLLCGDERGGVHLLWFLKPHAGLFESPSGDDNGPRRIYMKDIGDHGRLVSYQNIPAVHQEPINRILYEAHTDLIVTSSESDAASVVIMNTSPRRNSCVWKINKGVTCFDFSRSLNLLVTGGLDPAVKLWNRFLTAWPIAVLSGHSTTVLDVVIYRPLGQVLSYSNDAELRVWDISSHCCLRTVRLQFPCLLPGRTPGHGNFPFLLVAPPLPSQTPPHILVSCRDYLARLRLKGGGEGRRTQSPAGSLSCVLHNPTLKQVIGGCEDSSVSVWDIETGSLCLRISSAHGDEPITCMALMDSSHRRLVTGARNGTIKVWNLLNGHNLHKLEPVNDSEITGIICLHDNRLLVVGWSQKVAQYDITGAKDVYVRADMSWKSGQQHRADILTIDHCPALGIVATGSHDGEVIVWTLDTQRPLVRLRRDTRSLTVPPVDVVFFLQRRVGDRHTPLLLISQAGGIYWWSINGDTLPKGQFYAPCREEQCVLGLSSDQENSILVTADTAGSIQVWDISQYLLSVPQEPVSSCPPLLHSWRAHEGAVVSVEAQVYSERRFFLSGSVDGTIKLWTGNGGLVGFFGQESNWKLNDPATYHLYRRQQNNMTEEEKDERQERSERVHTNDLVNRTPEGPVETEKAPSVERQTGSLVGQRVLSISASQHTELFGCNQRKMSLRRERRQAFGNIDVNKIFPIGGVCTPFQALAVQDCRDVFLLDDLPVSS
ncbi:hypothetical protein DPEC_G00358450 [Dallia pectoralis]|uniref:Uncharacterized protein n=1 Tax=Dallia pectoralis TaxID=75939 RepID=A0ACC2F089_DALPE|nr:hypothetical protein DPEC_G00358450 [Dallia pectoralis]